MEEIGLLLHNGLAHAGYWCTPINSAVFASTGGDGVHFSLIDVGDGFGETSPIVMTVPMSSDPNWIVGENLLDFLALGLGSGYFVLESLAYGAEWHGDIEGSADDSQVCTLGDLRDRFDLRPWSDVDERLRFLDERFGDTLIVADRPDDSAH